MTKSTFLLTLVLVAVCLTALPQSRQRAFEMNERLGRGINIGNTFEAPTETEWGNPWHASYFKRIAALGFHHVRVPIRWETPERSMAVSPFTIDEDFLGRIREVIDSARRYKLHIIINMHHHDGLFEDPAGQKDRFLSQWYQVANYFKDYSDSLLFEVLNEPHGNLTAEMWNEYFAEALGEIRKTNPDRIVLMGIADYGGLGSVSKIELPNDDNLILTVHYYNPFAFTHQGAEWVAGADQWLGTEWLDTEADRQAVESEFSYVLQFSEVHNIPIHVGEFGAYSKADLESRERWTTFLARWFEEQSLSWAYWEFSAGFGIFNPQTQQYASGLVDALLHNEMAEPTPVFAVPVYSSNFTQGADGWSLSQQGGASAVVTTGSNQLTVSASNGGTETWHLQLVKSNIPLQTGKTYRLSFSAQAATDRGITFYAGKASAPWNAYSSYNSVSLNSIKSAYTFVFVMTSPTDPAARLVFDLGLSTQTVSISEIKVEALTFAVTSISPEGSPFSAAVYPNPANSELIVDGGPYRMMRMYDIRGRLLNTTQLSASPAIVDISHLSPGVYVLSLSNNNETVTIRIIKK